MQRAQLVSEHDLYYNLMSQSQDASTQEQYANIIYQYEYQLAPEYIGQTVINQMIDDIIIRQEAKSRGIEVSEAEILETLQNVFGYYPDGVPTYTPAPTSEAEEGETAAPAAAPTSVTKDEYSQALDEYLTGFDEYGVNEEVLNKIIEAQLYREKLSEILSAGVINEEEQVWARHILVEDLDTAEMILTNLDDGESTWEDLALEYSIDTSNAANGGDLGWFSEGTMVTEFNDAAFDGEIGEILGPVETQFGFHLIEVLGHEVRPLDDTEFENRINLALVDLISEIKGPAEEAGEIDLIENWTKYTPTQPKPLYTLQQ